MNNKYELTNETITTPLGNVLHRIKALIDIGVWVKAGDLGGWIETEANLRVSGEAWVFDKAQVSGEAQVFDKAQVSSVLSVLWNRYAANILPLKAGVKIRIGCEVHTIKEWDEHGAAYARKDNEAEWWENHGQYIYEFMKGEAERYLESLKGRQPSQQLETRS
jgi:hypothetical protein